MKQYMDRILSLLSSEKLLQFINRSSDLLLAGWVVGIMAMMIIPIPPVLIDIVIAFNLTAAIGLIMVAIYIPNALQLSMFPSLLLITTLFRLGIEISSTRQILLHAFAGHVIQTFGNFVVGGNFVIGGIIFLIIIIFQFLFLSIGSDIVD
jgi:type III secretion protein V